MDAFISYSSHDVAVARRLEADLEQDGLSVWRDDSDLRVGSLLRTELRQAVADAGALVLLWSVDAERSRWVAMEWLVAILAERLVLACALDGAPLPQCLRSTVHVDGTRDPVDWTPRLARAIRAARGATTPLAPVMRYASPELQAATDQIAAGQAALGDQLGRGDVTGAAETQALLDGAMTPVRERWPLDTKVVKLDGYHHKNAYMLHHWDAVQAGRAPDDPLLDRAEQRFLETLAVDPRDYEALNGLGSVLTFERELDAAEFFILEAIRLAKEDGIDPYPAAEADLALVRWYKG